MFRINPVAVGKRDGVSIERRGEEERGEESGEEERTNTKCKKQ